MKITDLQMVRPPQFCDDCGRALVDRAAESGERMTQIMHHCPHHRTLILITLDTVNGERAITKWILESPCSEERFVEMASLLAESTGTEMETFHSGRVQ